MSDLRDVPLQVLIEALHAAVAKQNELERAADREAARAAGRGVWVDGPVAPVPVDEAGPGDAGARWLRVGPEGDEP